MVRSFRGVLLTYLVVGAALWPLPLLNVLHVESAAVVALVAFFVAGITALSAFGAPSPASVKRVLIRQESALLVPLAMLTVSLLWAPNCDYGRGLLFFGLFPSITVVFAVMLAYALSATPWRRKRLLLIGTGVAVALLGVVYDLGFHPQFYTYNHVFGGVLGPLYDERLAVRPGLFAFRGLTLLWALALYLVGRLLSVRNGRTEGAAGSATEDRGWRIEDSRVSSGRTSILNSPSSIFADPSTRCYGAGLLAVLALIGLSYAFSASLGFNTPAWYLQDQLGAQYQTEHFVIYYDSTEVDTEDIAHLARDHEYRYAWLTDRIGAEGPDRIASYLYPDPEMKARLTGARQTSIAPVWLPAPQVHLLQERYEQSFGHELAHVFTRSWGLPVINASWSVGLVEGTAVALEPPNGRPIPREQVAVAALLDSTDAETALADDLAARFSPLGFWTSRGAVSYATMGSFVRFLLDRYGPKPLRRVYARANFEAVYGRSVEAMAREWEAWVRAVPVVDRSTEALVTRRFARPSLFERRCPHYIPPYRRALEAGQEALAEGDTSAAEGHFREATRRQPQSVEAQGAWGRLQLAQGRPDVVAQRLDTLTLKSPSVPLLLLRGDAAALLHHSSDARRSYTEALEHLPLYAHESRSLVYLRRAVAARPDVVRILTSADSARTQARRLAKWPDSAAVVQAWRAYRHMQAGEHGAAWTVWKRLPSAIDETAEDHVQAHLRRQGQVWKARTAVRLRKWTPAEAEARAAVEAFRAVGAVNLAAELDDLAHKARWMRRESNPAGDPRA